MFRHVKRVLGSCPVLVVVDKDLEVEEVEPSLADLMMGDALQNKAERAAKTAKEEKRMKKSFGDGMKKGLKKGFSHKQKICKQALEICFV